MAEHMITRHRIGTAEQHAYEKFIAPPEEPLTTLDRVTPDVVLRRKVGDTYDLALPFRLPDGTSKLKMWIIRNPDGARTFPSDPIRVRAGQNVHVRTTTGIGPHTIHFHGIEGTPMNDGVGKHSFEIEDVYTYQFTAREPGFYFYHCHRNTPLHFEMGLYGVLIVDPPQGPGFVRAYAPQSDHVVRYDREVTWACGAHDHRWRKFSHNHAFSDSEPNDPKSFTAGGGLDTWRPSVFTISGAVARDGATPITDPRAMGRATVGETVLVRVLNATYAVQEYRIGADVLVIAQDGRAFGVPPFGSYSEPFVIPAGQPFKLTSAMRYELLIRPTGPGTIPMQVDYRDWVTKAVLGRARTSIVVT